ncbi:MAG: hypothetical protein IH840_00150 [Candidatus Heimdallarchaeota archaeon]|nr:hypothetical protein [Candidatus Heimdallarchaeota archaeon]
MSTEERHLHFRCAGCNLKISLCLLYPYEDGSFHWFHCGACRYNLVSWAFDSTFDQSIEGVTA